jgi:energy-converting hydrogenase Eha subunit C
MERRHAMAKKKSSPTSLKSMALFSAVATAFVVAIAAGAFDDVARVAIAGVITFVVVMGGLLVLNLIAKDDETEPGKPRLK